MKTDFVSWEQAVNWLVEQPEHEQLVRECYFDRPVINAVRRYSASDEWQELVRHLPASSGKALDVGAGNGIVSYALAKQGWQVCALEPDPSDLVGAGAIRKIASDEQLAIEVTEQAGEAMPFSDAAFDLVMARQVTHHASDLDQMYAEIARVLKPGGTGIAFRDHVISSAKGLKRFQDNHPLHNLYGGENAFRLGEYRTAIRKSGLEITREYHQFESAINYAPKSKEDICRAIANPLRLPALKGAAFKVVGYPYVFKPLMKMAGFLYRKPGRLVSFVCRKPL